MAMDQSSESLPYLLQERENSAFDAFLYVGETLILKAHKHVLSLAIPFFKRTFESGMKEAETGEVKFSDQEASSDALCDLVCVAYGNKLEIDAANVRELHDTANFLEMNDVTQRCVEFMKNNMSVDTVFVVWGYGDKAFDGSEKLLGDCAKFIKEHFLDLYKKEDFLKQNVDTLSQFLSSKNLSVCSENDVVDALLRWLIHDWKNRLRLVKDRSLLNMVIWKSVDRSVQRFMSLKSLRNNSRSEPDEMEALLMIYEKVSGLPEFVKAPNSRKKAKLPQRPTKCLTSEAGFVYSIQRGGEDNHQLLIYDPIMEHFHGPAPLKMPESITNVLGMILHESRPFVVASGEKVMLLELKDGLVESAIDLQLPAEEEMNGCSFVLIASPTNSDKFCIGLCKGPIFKMIIVYDMSTRQLSGGEECQTLRPFHCITYIPKTAAKESNDTKFAYTPGKIWGFRTKVICYDLNLKSWSKALDIKIIVGRACTISEILVAFDYIIIAFRDEDDCQIRMFNYRSGSNGGLIPLSCNGDYYGNYMLSKVSLSTMGQLLLVFLHSNAICLAFSVKLGSDGRPSGQLTHDESMDQFNPEHMIQITEKNKSNILENCVYVLEKVSTLYNWIFGP